MAIAWFIVPYNRRADTFLPTRYLAIDDDTTMIYSEGGQWSETEIMGNRAIVKVRASATTLATLATKYKRLPKAALDMPLSDLTTAQKNALRNEAIDQGYTLAEIQARFGNDLGAHTLGDVLHFMASRRLKPRYDAVNDVIVCDGLIQECRTIESVNAEVGE